MPVWNLNEFFPIFYAETFQKTGFLETLCSHTKTETQLGFIILIRMLWEAVEKSQYTLGRGEVAKPSYSLVAYLLLQIIVFCDSLLQLSSLG